MTTAPLQSLMQRLENPRAMWEYLDARLHGDAERAPPPIDQYHGIEDFEDVLIALASDPNFTEEQHTWFWGAVRDIAGKAWQSSDHETFRRIVTMAWRLGRPGSAFDHLDFLPADSDGFQWDKAERLLVGAHALLWLLVWEARRDPTFWRDNLRSILRQAPPDEAKYLALVRAVDGAGVLDHELWLSLLRDALHCTSFPVAMLRTALLGQWQLAGGVQDAEYQLVQTLGISLAKTRQARTPDAAWMRLQQLLVEWRNVPWTEPSQRALNELMHQNGIQTKANGPVPAPRKPLVSPKRYQSGLRKAA